MPDGLSVRGLNTAATPWCAAAVGCLAGVGPFVLAVCGTAGVVGASLLLRPLGRRLDRARRGRDGRRLPRRGGAPGGGGGPRPPPAGRRARGCLVGRGTSCARSAGVGGQLVGGPLARRTGRMN
ncbi:MgtC/SapB family protein [Streptomyces sp. NPDC056400]|uniref:MgtC/SapB family protein n=1 Tax=Streptomyces sp. NPDC056400 TaxID=3345808 RepID=UPI0035E103B8